MVDELTGTFVFCSGILYLIFGVLAGCGPTSKNPGSLPNPLYVVVILDASKSADANGIPFVTLEHVEAIIEKYRVEDGVGLTWRSGILAIGVVDEQGYKPFIKMRISPVHGGLKKRATVNPRNENALADFLEQVKPLLAGSRTAQRSDVYGTLDRATLFFNEPTIPTHATRILMFASDGEHDANKRPKSPQLPKAVQVLTIGMKTHEAKNMFGDKVICFESFGSTIESIDKET